MRVRCVLLAAHRPLALAAGGPARRGARVVVGGGYGLWLWAAALALAVRAARRTSMCNVSGASVSVSVASGEPRVRGTSLSYYLLGLNTRLLFLFRTPSGGLVVLGPLLGELSLVRPVTLVSHKVSEARNKHLKFLKKKPCKPSVQCINLAEAGPWTVVVVIGRVDGGWTARGSTIAGSGYPSNTPPTHRHPL